MISGILGFLLWPKNRDKPNETNQKDLRSHRLEDLEVVSRKKSKTAPRRDLTDSRRNLAPAKKAPEKDEPLLMCYLCGQHFPQRSLTSHISQCLKTWRRREETKPIEHQVPVPSAPKELSNSLPDDDTAIAQFNQSMRSTWSKSSTLRCPHCNKSFKASDYKKHIKTCLATLNQQEKLPERQEPIKSEDPHKRVVRKCKTFDPKRATSKEDFISTKKSETTDQVKKPIVKVPKQSKIEEDRTPKSEAQAIERKEKPNKTSKTPRLSRDSASMRSLNQIKSMKAPNEVDKAGPRKDKNPTASSRDLVGRSASFSHVEPKQKLESLVQPKASVHETETKLSKEKTQNASVSINDKSKMLPAIRTKPKTEEQSTIRQEPTLPAIRTKPKTDDLSTTKQEPTLPAIRTKPKTEDLSTTKQEPTLSAMRTKPETKDQSTIKKEPTLPAIRTKPKTEDQSTTKQEPTLSAVRTKPETEDQSTIKKEPTLPAIKTKQKTEDLSTIKKGPLLQKSVSWKDQTHQEELDRQRRSIRDLSHSKSMAIRRPQKTTQELDKTSACSSPSSAISKTMAQTPFSKGGPLKRTPLTERGPLPQLRESLSADSSLLLKRGSDPITLVPDRPKLSTHKAPVAYHCYLCGQPFGSASLLIHVRRCRQLWEDREALKLKKQDRRPPPAVPKELEEPLPTDAEGIASFNQTMIHIWESQALISCPNCARTFTSEAFEKHQRLCTPQTPGGPHGLSKHRRVASDATPSSGACSERTKEDSGIEVSSGPLQYSCYLCGRQYGNRSLMLHIPRCQKLWQEREALKPRKQDRKPLPDLPPLIKDFPDFTLPTHAAEVKEFNDTMYEYWNRFSLCVCKICGRSFNDESFEKHQKTCTPENPGGALGLSKQYQAPLQESTSHDSTKKEPHQERKSQPRHLVCYLCGRKYGTESLVIHLRHCEKQWMADEAHRPKHMQRPLPPAPERIALGDFPKTPDEIEDFNEEMTLYWKENTLIKCQTCLRTFNAEAFETHLRSCTQQTSRTYRRMSSSLV